MDAEQAAADRDVESALANARTLQAALVAIGGGGVGRCSLSPG